MTRVGTTPAVAVHPASRELARPIRRSITRHSPIQVVSQKCLQPPDPAPHHSAPQNQISPQLVLSISESLATVAVTVPTRATIAVQLNLANGSHIARNCSKLAEMTRHLLIALQPRRVGAPHLVGMESNHLGYDSTAQSRQGAVVATRYPLFVQRKVSLPLTIQIKKEGERRFLLLTINTTKPAIVAQENYTLSATFSLLATFVFLLRQPLGGLPAVAGASGAYQVSHDKG